MALLMADPELAKLYDDMGRAKGEELFRAAATSVGIGDLVSGVDNTLTGAYDAQSEFGSAQALKGEMARFVYEGVKATIAEVPGLISSAFDWADKVSTDTLNKTQPIFRNPRPGSYTEDVNNRGLLKNSWT